MKRLSFVLFGLLALTYLSACSDNSQSVVSEDTRSHANDDTAQRQENNKQLQAIPNDPTNFSALPTTQPLSNSQAPAGPAGQ